MSRREAKRAVSPVKDLVLQSPDGLREVVRAVLREGLQAEMSEAVGAAKGERPADGLGWRAGYYRRPLFTRLGCVKRALCA